MSSIQINRAVLRTCEAEVLRARARLERHYAERLRDQSAHTFEVFENDTQQDVLRAQLHDAEANLLDAQAEYVLHSEAEEA